jgi:hypothetical protein
MEFFMPAEPEVLTLLFKAWLVVLGLGLLTTLNTLLLERFKNDAIYTRHCRFWFRTAVLLSLVQLPIMFYVEGYIVTQSFCSVNNICLVPWFVFSILLLLVTLVPAKLQNACSKNVE